MQNASTNQESQSKRGKNSINNSSGPSKRPRTPGPTSRFFERVEPSQIQMDGRSYQNFHKSNTFSPPSKGIKVNSISKASFKKSKHKERRAALRSITAAHISPDMMQVTATKCQIGISSPAKPLSILKSKKAHFQPSSSIYRINSPNSVNNSIQSKISINANYSNLSPFKYLTHLSNPRDIPDFIMASNPSSPHSSNSITQPCVPLSPTLQPNYQSNPPHLTASVPNEEYNDIS